MSETRYDKDSSVGLDPRALAGMYYRGKTDVERLAAGRQIMRGVLGMLGASDRAHEPLVRHDGEPMIVDGQPLLAEDYLAVAPRHGGADRIIVGYYVQASSDEHYASTDEGRRSYELLDGMVNAYFPARENVDPR